MSKKYLHRCYNPHLTNINKIIQQIEDEENGEYKFFEVRPVNEFEYIAIFEKEQGEARNDQWRTF